MMNYYSVKFFVEKFNENINQKNITENIIDKICKILDVEYDELGYIYFHPDFHLKNIGKMFSQNKKEQFYSVNIETKMQGIKYPDVISSPTLIYKKINERNSEYSDFIIKIYYPIKNEALYWEIVIREDLLKNKEIDLRNYFKILEIISNNNFIVNTSFVHYYVGSKNRRVVNGYATQFNTFEEIKIVKKAHNHRVHWKNKIIDIFLYNAISSKCLSQKEQNKLKQIVGRHNVILECDYIVFTYKTTKTKYLLERFIPSPTKIRLRNLLKRLL